MNDTQRAKELLCAQGSAYTCVLCRGDEILTSTKTGIAPMMDFLDSGADLCGFCAADRIVGKAAAMLFVLAGVREVYAEVITDEAIRILSERQIGVSFSQKVPMIINRMGSGPCPMEATVKDLECPQKAREEIRKTMLRLSKK